MNQDLRSDRESTRAFFGARAARWEQKFPDDGPAYARAIAEVGLSPRDFVLDAGCGTGRALPALRAAVGPTGTVLGIDVTAQMLAVAQRAERTAHAALVEADVARLPLPDGRLDAVFAAGLLAHLRAPERNLRELARVCRPHAVLALFHPVGRAALAAHQGRRLSDDDLRAEPQLRPLLAASGWRLTRYADDEDRYLALAVREPTPAPHPDAPAGRPARPA